MDAIEFLKQRHRMCDMETCDSCSASVLDECHCEGKNIVELVEIVEKWAQEHPKKTILQDFFEKFPNAPRTVDGLPFPCPFECGYSKNNNCPFGKNNPSDDCSKCWFRPLEES